MVLCQIVAASSGGPASLATADDLTHYEDEKGGGGLYSNVNINDIGFKSAVSHHLEDACKYDAQISMHVSFGRMGLVVPETVLRGNNLISAARLCDGMASGKFSYFFTPMLSGEREANAAAKALMSKVGSFEMVSKETCIDVRFHDGANCSVMVEAAGNGSGLGREPGQPHQHYALRAVVPSAEEIANAPRQHPLLSGSDLEARVAAMTMDLTTGLIKVPIPDDLVESRDIVVLGQHLIDRQRKVTRRLFKSRANGLYASQVMSRIADCPDPTVEEYRCRPDLVEVTTTLTRDHLRTISAAEVAASARFMAAKPPGFPVYMAHHFAGGLSCDARVWLSEIPPSGPGTGGTAPVPWTADIGCVTAYRALGVVREVCKAVNIACSGIELEKLREMAAARQREREVTRTSRGGGGPRPGGGHAHQHGSQQSHRGSGRGF